MRLWLLPPGLLIIMIILWDAFETIILPRRVTRRIRLTSVFYRLAWTPSAFIAGQITSSRWREKLLGFFGPLSLLMLLATWATGLILGYALVLWGTDARLSGIAGGASFATHLYLSGVTFFTLGYGDVSPVAPLGRTLAVLEAATGFSLFAAVIGYLPVLYQAFSKREANIVLLDARAGSPSSAAELLRRHGEGDSMKDLKRLLQGWEVWAAELLESHLSYPVLCYFRSQHDNQSWLSALTTILDACSLVIVGIKDGPAWQARLTFAIARHAVVDLAQVFRTPPAAGDCCTYRLPPSDLQRLREVLRGSGVQLDEGWDAESKLLQLRQMYEPYVVALSDYLMLPISPWIVPPDAIDNWKTSAWGRIQ